MKFFMNYFSVSLHGFLENYHLRFEIPLWNSLVLYLYVCALFLVIIIIFSTFIGFIVFIHHFPPSPLFYAPLLLFCVLNKLSIEHLIYQMQSEPFVIT